MIIVHNLCTSQGFLLHLVKLFLAKGTLGLLISAGEACFRALEWVEERQISSCLRPALAPTRFSRRGMPDRHGKGEPEEAMYIYSIDN